MISTPSDYTIDASGGFTLTTPAAVEIVAPGGFNLLAPGGQVRIDNFFTQLGEKIADTPGMKNTIIVLREDAIGAYVDLAGAKIDAFGVKSTNAGSANAWAAVATGSRVNELLCGAIRKWCSGLACF